MQKEVFYGHLREELAQNRALYPYYKLIDGDEAQQQFRKAYFLQRLDYLDRHLDLSKNPKIWDCGCGYGTTCLYLAMNGQPTFGTTLEYYMEQIDNRRKFWSQFGNTDLFQCAHLDVFDQEIEPESFDYIILQDTLHHIEPMQDALKIFLKALKKGGKLVLIEENGGSFVKNTMLFFRRGNKRIIKIYDETLKKEILLGNENIRPEKKWRKAFLEAGFKEEPDSVQYIRCLPPRSFKKAEYEKVIENEQRYWQERRWFCRSTFFGLNMVFVK